MFRLEIYGSVFLIMASWLMAVTSSADKIEKYHVQARVFVDSQAFAVWKRMLNKNLFDDYVREIRRYFAQIQRVYDSLKMYYSIAITMNVESVEMLKGDIMKDPYTRNRLMSCLSTFRKSINWSWKKKPYDLAILLTGYPIGNVLGFANLGTVCTSNAVGVIQQKATRLTALVLAHEIGHILGAPHDSGKYVNQRCYKLNGQVMNPSPGINSQNNYIFSPCSYAYIQQRLRSLDKRPGVRNCLKDGRKTDFAAVIGDSIAPDDYCKKNKLGGDFISRTKMHKNSYAQICQHINCYEANGKKYHSIRKLQGMQCGKNKVCNKDVCEESPDGSPFVTDSCPLGDQPRLPPNFDISCEDIDPSECPKYMVECCHTCSKTNKIYSKTADDVCHKFAGKKYFMLREFNLYGDQLCSKLICGTRKNGKMVRKTFMAPNGMACGNVKRCSWGKCVRTKYGNPDMPNYCPFGDQDLERLGFNYTCQEITKGGQSCRRYGKTCCKSCKRT